jgi:BASS family bile acid:Na+ symporter
MFRRILSFYTKYFAVWVVTFGVVAYFYPKPFVSLKPYMDWFFGFTMFGIGAVLEVEDFKKIVRRPGVVLIGTVAQFLIMPTGAYVLARVFNLPPEIGAGLILTAAAPEAMSSGVISYVAKADVAYSVSLTTVSTFLCPICTPALTYLLVGRAVEFDFWSMVVGLMLMVIAPLAAGFGVRYYFKERIEKVLEVFPAISVTFIIFICSLVIALNKNYLVMVTGAIVAADLILNIWGMTAGYWVGALFRMDVRKRRTLSIEVGMQNAGLGTILALKYFGERAAIPAAAFVFICIITAAVMAEIWRRQTTANV